MTQPALDSFRYFSLSFITLIHVFILQMHAHLIKRKTDKNYKRVIQVRIIITTRCKRISIQIKQVSTVHVCVCAKYKVFFKILIT